MLNKILFKKIELWLLLTFVIIALVSAVLFGWIVKRVALGGSKPGVIGEMAFAVASFPSDVLLLVRGADKDGLPTDYVSSGLIALYELDKYESVVPGEKYGPKFIATEKAKDLQPLTVQTRYNLEGDELIAVFDGDRKLVKTLPLKPESMIEEVPALIGASPHHFFDDGSYLVWPYGGAGLYRMDPCGNVVWKQDGLYHHHFSVVDGKLYLLGLPSNEILEDDQKKWNHTEIINVIDIESGDILRSIRIEEIAKTNLPDFDPFFYKKWTNKLDKKGRLRRDFLHPNKIDVLPAEMKDQYPTLPEGAMMVSMRNVNLVFVMDPETLKIVWYSHGHTQLQHDPKFIGDNKISVFNNSYDGNSDDKEDPSNFTSIRNYDFGTEKWTTRYNAKAINGFTEFGGNFDISDGGNLVLNIALQGRVVEIAPDGEVLFEFISTKDDDEVYWGKGREYISPSTLDILMKTQCN